MDDFFYTRGSGSPGGALRPEPPSDALTSSSVTEEDILVLRRGPGANCSSIGSALDLLFLSAVAGGAVLAVVAAAFGPRPRPESQDGVSSPSADSPPEDLDARPR